MYYPIELPSIEEIQQIEEQRQQAINSLEIYDHSVKCQRCDNAIKIFGKLTPGKQCNNRIQVLKTRIKWIEEHYGKHHNNIKYSWT
jgi:hypothetical protein